VVPLEGPGVPRGRWVVPLEGPGVPRGGWGGGGLGGRGMVASVRKGTQRPGWTSHSDAQVFTVFSASSTPLLASPPLAHTHIPLWAEQRRCQELVGSRNPGHQGPIRGWVEVLAPEAFLLACGVAPSLVYPFWIVEWPLRD
jgi:hypothetical protein